LMGTSSTLEENDIAWRDDFGQSLMNSWIASDKSTRIPISTFQLALQLHGVEVDVEEVECMLANMVYRVSPSIRLLLLCISRALISFAVDGRREDEKEKRIRIRKADSQGYMKGYISHEKSMVVLAKTNPFPNLNSIAR
jgi:hypothetical protein